MQRQSPPKHRHDGTSPLPLGMDWSPPPKNWAGQETVWPHDPHTGWSYCVTIPSWVVLAKSTNSDPIVFYRVLVGLQSPDGNTTTRVVLRRFNDFLKFLAVLKRMFPKKNIPPAPPKGFLRMKTRTLLEEVKDLEVELEATKKKSKENLEQAILIERERVTQMQWDMEELRRKSFEMELKLNLHKGKVGNASIEDNASQEKDRVLQELDATKQKLDELQKQHQELEVKSKADVKVLIKEVRSLRGSQADLKKQLNHSLEKKLEAERLYDEEKLANEQARTSFMKLLHKCQVLRQRFEECNINLVNENEDDLVMDHFHGSCSDALNLLATYDNQINFLLAEVNTDEGTDSSSPNAEKMNEVNSDSSTVDEKLRNMLTDVLVDNGKLRKQVNSVIRYALRKKMSSPGESEDSSRENVQNKHLDR